MRRAQRVMGRGHRGAVERARKGKGWSAHVPVTSLRVVVCAVLTSKSLSHSFYSTALWYLRCIHSRTGEG